MERIHPKLLPTCPLGYVYGKRLQRGAYQWRDEEEKTLIGLVNYGRQAIRRRHGQKPWRVYPWNFLDPPRKLNAKKSARTHCRDWMGGGPGPRQHCGPVGRRAPPRPVAHQRSCGIGRVDITRRQVLWDAGIIFELHKILTRQDPLGERNEVCNGPSGGVNPRGAQVFRVKAIKTRGK